MGAGGKGGHHSPERRRAPRPSRTRAPSRHMLRERPSSPPAPSPRACSSAHAGATGFAGLGSRARRRLSPSTSTSVSSSLLVLWACPPAQAAGGSEAVRPLQRRDPGRTGRGEAPSPGRREGQAAPMTAHPGRGGAQSFPSANYKGGFPPKAPSFPLRRAPSPPPVRPSSGRPCSAPPCSSQPHRWVSRHSSAPLTAPSPTVSPTPHTAPTVDEALTRHT